MKTQIPDDLGLSEIATLPPGVRAFLLTVIPDIKNIKCTKRLADIRIDLGTLTESLPNKYKGYTTNTIRFVKRQITLLNDNNLSVDEFTPKHLVTDHAFVQYLSRAHGLNIGAIKDRIIEQNNMHSILLPIYREDGALVTFLPKEGGYDRITQITNAA